MSFGMFSLKDYKKANLGTKYKCNPFGGKIAPAKSLRTVEFPASNVIWSSLQAPPTPRALLSRRLALKQSSCLFALDLNMSESFGTVLYSWKQSSDQFFKVPLGLRPNSAIRKCCRGKLIAVWMAAAAMLTHCSLWINSVSFNLGVQLIKNGKKIAAFVPRLVRTKLWHVSLVVFGTSLCLIQNCPTVFLFDQFQSFQSDVTK